MGSRHQEDFVIRLSRAIVRAYRLREQSCAGCRYGVSLEEAASTAVVTEGLDASMGGIVRLLMKGSLYEAVDWANAMLETDAPKLYVSDPQWCVRASK